MTERLSIQAADFTPLSDFSDVLAKIKDRADGSKGPGQKGALGSILKALRQIALQGGARLPVTNATSSDIAAGKAVSVTGYDRATGRFKITLADQSTGVPAHGVTHELIKATTGTSDLMWDYLLKDSPLDTSGGGVTLGAKVYLSTSGALTLTAPTTMPSLLQVVGFVDTKDATGDIRVKVQDVDPAMNPIKTIAFGTLTAEVADARKLDIQVKELNGANVAGVRRIRVTTSLSQYSNASTGSANLSDGGAGTLVSSGGTKDETFDTDAAGLLQVNITDLASETVYVDVQMAWGGPIIQQVAKQAVAFV